MGITQGMVPAGGAPAVLGSPSPGEAQAVSPGERAWWDPGARGNPPMGLSNLGVRGGVHSCQGKG